MQSFWRLLNKPRIDDWSPLAKFYYADDALNSIATELDSFDGRRDPERCNQLVNKLRQAQDRVLHIISEMLLIVFPNEEDRACRDYRVKFPDEILHDNLPGQLWFGAECLAAGSNIVDHEAESEAIRPMAKAVVRHVEKLRDMLREQAIRDPSHYPDLIKCALQVFDKLFADFELAYVSAMVPVKSVREYDRQLDVAVLFADCLNRAIKVGYITREQIDECEPNVIIALPRLAIIWGLIYYPDGALNMEKPKEDVSEMFRHFHKLLILVRNLLFTLSNEELCRLEQKLVSGSEEYSPMGGASVRELEQEIESFDHKNSGTFVGGLKTPLERQTMINRHEYHPRDDFSESGVAYVFRNPRCSQLIPLNDEKSNYFDRSLYGSSENLIHRLFVCVAGIADQLQTNYSQDIRKVLKMVLQPVETVPIYEVSGKTAPVPVNEEETGIEVRESLPLPTFVGVRWVPDADCDQCTACSILFTLVRRRHHCRNCGRIFCGQCSANQIPIPELGYERKVRVCDLCFEYRVRQHDLLANSSGSIDEGNFHDGEANGGAQRLSSSPTITTPRSIPATTNSAAMIISSSTSSSRS